MWARDIPVNWIIETLEHTYKFDNQYLFQSKNPSRFIEMIEKYGIDNSVFCTTIETNRFIPEIMGNTPRQLERSVEMNEIYHSGYKTYVTIEPIMDFNLEGLLYFVTL